jgi:hypothetical protein
MSFLGGTCFLNARAKAFSESSSEAYLAFLMNRYDCSLSSDLCLGSGMPTHFLRVSRF